MKLPPWTQTIRFRLTVAPCTGVLSCIITIMQQF